jgi:uncharacterized protein with HEPN domain
MSEEKKDRDIKDYLNDILEKIADIGAFTEGMGYEDLETDKKTQYAVIRCLEVIGEAAKKIPDKSREMHPGIPWQEISGMRDKLIHEYFGVDLNTVWDTIQEDLSPLKEAVENLLHDLT